MILDRSIEMEKGEVEIDEKFICLVKFENWLSNSGLTGFAQDFKEAEIAILNTFATEFNFPLIKQMMILLEKYNSKYGVNFIDEVSDYENDDLSQFDNDFYKINDMYTQAIYDKYVQNICTK